MTKTIPEQFAEIIETLLLAIEAHLAGSPIPNRMAAPMLNLARNGLNSIAARFAAAFAKFHAGLLAPQPPITPRATPRATPRPAFHDAASHDTAFTYAAPHDTAPHDTLRPRLRPTHRPDAPSTSVAHPMPLPAPPGPAAKNHLPRPPGIRTPILLRCSNYKPRKAKPPNDSAHHRTEGRPAPGKRPARGEGRRAEKAGDALPHLPPDAMEIGIDRLETGLRYWNFAPGLSLDLPSRLAISNRLGNCIGKLPGQKRQS